MPGLQRIEVSDAFQDAQAPLMDTMIPDPFVQNVFVLRHGEEILSNPEADMDTQAGARRWDPPLTARGKQQAWGVGRKMQMDDWNISRVVVSPVLRCVQTAVEVIAGLGTKPSRVHMWDTGHGSPNIVFSTIKASIDCGLKENLIDEQGVLPRDPLEDEDEDGFIPRTLDLSEIYSMLPIGIPDYNIQRIKQQYCHQSVQSAKDLECQYASTLKRITNKYPHENILCVTHGEAVKQSVSIMWPSVEVKRVAHCAHAHAQRPIFERGNGDWELLTESGPSSGIEFW